MTNFEKIKSLSLEELATLNVKSVTSSVCAQLFPDYVTTDGSVYRVREQAEEYERSWLQQEVDETIFN